MRFDLADAIRVHTGLRAADCPVYVTGDLHCDNGSLADDFAPRREAFVSLLGKVGPQNVVLGGDVLELWQAEERDVLQAYPIIASAIRRQEVRGVRGNHDLHSRLLGRRGVKWPASLRLGTVLIEHGHRADPWNSRYSWVGRALARMTGRLERLGIPWADNMGDWFRRTPATGAPWSAAERERQRRLLRGPFTTVVVTGHTHVPGLVRWNTARDGVDGVVANWGSWTSGIVNPHVVRLRTDRVELLEVVP